jgi:hypothetical protein
VLYLQLLQAVLLLQSALLWYNFFARTFKEMGFELNPYDPCGANKMIEGWQSTITWYVDDSKISHAKSSVVTDVIAQIKEQFEKMTVTRGKHHIILVGMDIVNKGDGNLSIGMQEYFKEAILEFGEDVLRPAVTPARTNILMLTNTQF